MANYRHVTAGTAVIPERAWVHLITCTTNDTDPAVIQITLADGPLDPITVPAGCDFGDCFSAPPRQVLLGPCTVDITDAEAFVVSWYEP